jgi:hypothetical protein
MLGKIHPPGYSKANTRKPPATTGGVTNRMRYNSLQIP